MCKKSDDSIMKSPGKYYFQRLGKFFFIIACVFFTLTGISTGQLYIVNTYVSQGDSTADFMQVHTIIVDLDQKAIVNYKVLADSGTILNKLPVNVSNVRGTFLISFWATGMMAKNSGFGGGESDMHYAVINYRNGNMNTIISDEITGAGINLLNQVPDEQGFRLSVVSDTGDIIIMPPAIYGLNRNNRFHWPCNYFCVKL